MEGTIKVGRAAFVLTFFVINVGETSGSLRRLLVLSPSAFKVRVVDGAVRDSVRGLNLDREVP